MGQEAKYIVRLTDEERHTLQQLAVGPRGARAKPRRARRLRRVDGDGPRWPDGHIAEAFGGGLPNGDRVGQRWGWRGVGGEAGWARQVPARGHANSTAHRKPDSRPSRVARRRRGGRLGRCACWQTNWSNGSWGLLLGGKPCGKRSKK